MSGNRRFLEGINVCLTSLSKDELQRAQTIIANSGGTHSPAIIDITGCIVTGSVNDKNYQAAQKTKKLACVTLKWLYDCYKESKLEPEKRLKLPLPLEDYPVPPFLGLTVTCTQVTQEERKEIETLVKAHRGTYSAELIKGTCTHLVCLVGDMTGSEKYRSARRWGMFTVSVKWVKDCVAQKRWLPEHNYLVIPDEKASSKAEKPQQQQQQPQQSASAKSDRQGDAQLIHAPGTTSSNSFSAVSSVAVSEAVSTTAAPAPPPPPPPVKEVNLILEINAYLSSLPVAKLPSPFELLSNNTSSNSSATSSSITVFAEEVFFLVGFNSELSDYLVKCILVGGGQLSHVLCQEVTCVVISEECRENDKRQYNSILGEIRRHPVGVSCVNLLYILESLFTFRRVIPLLDSSSSAGSSSGSDVDFHSRIPGYRIDFTQVETVEDLVDCTKYIAKQESVNTAAGAAAASMDELFADTSLVNPIKTAPAVVDKRRGGAGGGGNFLKEFQNKRKLSQLTGATASTAAATAPGATAAAATATTPSKSNGFAVPSGGPRTRLTRSHNLNDESQVVTYGDSEQHRYY